jgi:membrane-associated protease RseP (regulator of RpoE activity)
LFSLDVQYSSDGNRKIIEDLMEFGNVQRGVLGVEGRELNSAFSKEIGINETQGFYVGNVTKNSGAEKAGIEKGDIIVAIDNKDVKSFSDLTLHLNTKRPNDFVEVTVIRKGKTKNISIQLTKKEFLNYEFNGIAFEDINAADKKRFNLKEGINHIILKFTFDGKIIFGISVEENKIDDNGNLIDNYDKALEVENRRVLKRPADAPEVKIPKKMIDILHKLYYNVDIKRNFYG